VDFHLREVSSAREMRSQIPACHQRICWSRDATIGHERIAIMASHPLRVLCVDDNHDIADSEALLLGLYGFVTQACYDGTDALLLSGEFCPDAYLLDLDMPGLDGCEVARQLRARFNGPPPLLVAITAKTGKEDCRRTEEAGFDAHFIKPVEPNRLVELLKGLQPLPKKSDC
jgi:CheY-like chemotaxis protein